MRHDIEVVVDRLTADSASQTRLAEAVELALKLGEGNLIVAVEQGEGGAAVGARQPKEETWQRTANGEEDEEEEEGGESEPAEAEQVAGKRTAPALPGGFPRKSGRYSAFRPLCLHALPT